jgi:cellulose synthase/poly-beta-1,6-N-acetylglucosamine synthase-like glycosyltransferase
MSIAILAIGIILLILSLPAMLELTAFLFANLFLRGTYGAREPMRPPTAIRRLAILVPAHDEETCIARCVSSLLASESGPYQREVIVIADNCGDATAEIARKAGARVIERVDAEKRGKGAALDYAIAALKGDGYDAFIIVDADSTVDGRFIRVMGDNFAQGKEALQCVYLARNIEASPRIRLMNLSLLSMNVLRPMGRELLHLSAGIMGNGFGLTGELLGKIPYKANSITEDLEYHLSLIERGSRVRFVKDARVLADFPISKEGTETQRERWEGGRFRLQRLFLPKMAKAILSGNAPLIEPFLELMSLPLAYEALLLLALAFLPLPFPAYAAAALFIVAAHTVAAVLLYGTRRDFLAFLEIPRYVLWKLVRLPRILLASRAGTSWIRTKRD